MICSPPPLAGVAAVTRSRPAIAALPHVVVAIGAFASLGVAPAHKTLADAVESDALHLLQHMLADAEKRQHPFYVSMHVTRAACLAVKQRQQLRDSERMLRWLSAVHPHAVGADEVLAEAAATGDLRLLEWLHALATPLDPSAIDSSAVAARAAGNGHLHVLEWLVANRWSPHSKVPLREAVTNNQRQVLRWIDEHDVRFCIERGSVEAAAALGDIEMLEWLFARPREEVFGGHPEDAAAANGHVHVLEWLAANHRENARSLSARWNVRFLPTGWSVRFLPFGCADAAKNGHLHVVEWIAAHYPDCCTSEALEAAAAAGHLDVVTFLQTTLASATPWGRVQFIGSAGSKAALGGHLDVVKFLLKHHPRSGGTMMHAAAGSGNLELVQWLRETCDERVDARNIVDFAVRNGHLNVLEYCIQQGTKDITWLIASAAEGNQLALMQQIHNMITADPHSPLANSARGLERWAMSSGNEYRIPMNFAARNGNVEMLEWLDAHGYSECSASAMNWAALKGHVDALRWLHKHRTEGCSPNAMQFAAHNGHLETVRWLWKHRPESRTWRALDDAVNTGQTRIVAFLLQVGAGELATGDQPFSGSARLAIQTCRDAEMIHLLYEYRPDWVDLNFLRAQAERNETMRRWLREVAMTVE